MRGEGGGGEELFIAPPLAPPSHRQKSDRGVTGYSSA